MAADELVCWQGEEFREDPLLILDALDLLFPLQEVHEEHYNRIQYKLNKEFNNGNAYSKFNISGSDHLIIYNN